jgi:NitT/TauT family transport system ATP-binding protein
MDVGFTFRSGTLALSHLSLDIQGDGAITAIVGPSGCGKSTLLRIIAGLIKPTAGRTVSNFDAGPDRHPIGMVFQQDTLLPWLTVRDNVAVFFRMRRRGSSRSEVRQWVEELLDMVGLEEFADAYPNQLSGGMRRRVAFMAAAASRPQLLLLDEPFSSVDEPTRIQIHQQVHRVVRRLQMGAVIVTHDLAEAISLSDTVAILSARPGRVAKVREVALGQARDMLELRDRREFLELYGELWRDLSQQIGAGPPVDRPEAP